MTRASIVAAADLVVSALLSCHPLSGFGVEAAGQCCMLRAPAERSIKSLLAVVRLPCAIPNAHIDACQLA